MRIDLKNALSAAMAVAGLSIGLIAEKVVADTYPGTNDGRGPDASPISARWVPNPSTSTIPASLWDHLFGYLEDTVGPSAPFTIDWHVPGGDNTDFWLDDRLTDPTVFGRRTCRNAGSIAGTCESNDIFINLTNIHDEADTRGTSRYWFERKVWCHETGHGLGLGHENSCMVQGYSHATTYSSDHIGHINDRF